MTTGLSTPTIASSDSETRSHFATVLVYENLVTGRFAMQTYTELVRDWGAEFTLQFDLWRFDVLALPAVRDCAARQAAGADLVIVAGRPNAELAPALEEWAAQWQNARSVADGALLALTYPEAQTGTATGSLHRYCENLSARAQMDFIGRRSDCAGAGWKPGVARLPERAHRLSPLLEEILQRSVPVPHWGINE